MIEVVSLTKRYGAVTAVDDLSFTARPGAVTGFLGPNGAGKSTTMRVTLGLHSPTAGTVTVLGRPYLDLPDPMRHVGALLDARAVHGSRTARQHLRCLAATNNIPRARADEVLEMVGLAAAANRRAGTFSLGMAQRLGIATALLGDPAVLMFDEPMNGLDPEGIRWIRGLIRGLADQGRTLLVSSHLMSEMAELADQVIVIGRGRLIAATDTQELVRSHGRGCVHLRTIEPVDDRFLVRLREAGGHVELTAGATLQVAGLTSAEVGELALMTGVALSELTPQRDTLEDIFIRLTASSVDYETAAAEAAPAREAP